MRPQSSMGLGEKCLQTQDTDKSYVITVPLKPGQRRRPLRNLKMKENSRSTSEHQCTCCDKNGLSSDELETLRRSRNPTAVVAAHGEVQTNEAAQAYVSRPRSLRNSAITRGHACSSITGKALRRTRIYLWVGQQSKATCHQTRQEDSLQDGKFRTSCRPWIVVKFWYQLVFCVATAGLIKHIFKSSTRAKWRTRTRKLARFTKNSKYK